MDFLGILKQKLSQGYGIKGYLSGAGVVCLETVTPEESWEVIASGKSQFKFIHVEHAYVLDALELMARRLEGQEVSDTFEPVLLTDMKTNLGRHIRSWGSFSISYKSGKYNFLPSNSGKYEPEVFNSLEDIVLRCPQYA